MIRLVLANLTIVAMVITANAMDLRPGPAATSGTASPIGAAGGDLTGSYPNPTIGASKVTDSKVNLTTGAITSGTFGDNRVLITTGAISNKANLAFNNADNNWSAPQTFPAASSVTVRAAFESTGSTTRGAEVVTGSTTVQGILRAEAPLSVSGTSTLASSVTVNAAGRFTGNVEVASATLTCDGNAPVAFMVLDSTFSIRPNGSIYIGNPTGGSGTGWNAQLNFITEDSLNKPVISMRSAAASNYGYDFDDERASQGRLQLYTVAAGARTLAQTWYRTTQPAGTVTFPVAVGIGTEAPSTKLSVSGGVITSSTTSPAFACNAGTPAPNSVSTNQHGRFVAGTGAANCTVTFSAAWPKTPSCWCNDESQVVVVKAVATTATLVCTVAVSMSGDTINYGCMGTP